MNNFWFHMGVVVFLFLIEIVTGIIIRRRRKPYPTILFTIHKIIPIALLTFLVLLTINANRGGEPGIIVWIILAWTLLTLLGSAVSGGWISAVESYPQVLSPIHLLCAYATAPLGAIAFYLLLLIYQKS
jgi:hypothetical protein